MWVKPGPLIARPYQIIHWVPPRAEEARATTGCKRTEGRRRKVARKQSELALVTAPAGRHVLGAPLIPRPRLLGDCSYAISSV